MDRHASTYAAPQDENAMFLDILHEAPLFGHRKRTSIVGSILYCLLLAGYAILAAGAPWIFHPIRAVISPLLCSCAVVLLIVTGIFQQYLVYQVQKIRLQGYYVFSQKLKHIVRLPFATTAYGTAAMLLVVVWKPHINILSISVLLREPLLKLCETLTRVYVQRTGKSLWVVYKGLDWKRFTSFPRVEKGLINLCPPHLSHSFPLLAPKAPESSGRILESTVGPFPFLGFMLLFTLPNLPYLRKSLSISSFQDKKTGGHKIPFLLLGRQFQY